MPIRTLLALALTLFLAVACSTPEHRRGLRDSLAERGTILKEYSAGDSETIVLLKEDDVITKYRISDAKVKPGAPKQVKGNALYSVDTKVQRCKTYSVLASAEIDCEKLKHDADFSPYIK